MSASPRFLRGGLNRVDAELVAAALDLYAREHEEPVAGAVVTPERRNKARRARHLQEHLRIKLAGETRDAFERADPAAATRA